MDVGDRVKFVESDKDKGEVTHLGTVCDVENESRGFVSVQDEQGQVWMMHVERIEPV